MNPSLEKTSLVPDRTCGDCTFCCQHFHIEELQKPGGELCRHSVESRCTLYPAWPTVCRTFFCIWRQSAEMPHHARPDMLDVMFWTTGKPNPEILFENVYIAAAALKDPRSMDQPEVQRTVELFMSQGALPIFLQWGGQQFLIHPGPELADAILHPASTPHRHLVEKGRAWLARYAPLARQFAGPRALLPAGC